MNIQNIFQGLSLTTLPVGLFDNTAFTNISYAFRGMVDLTTIPDSFITNTNITNVQGMFYDCTGLTTIPSDLFDGMPNLTDITYMFTNDVNVTSAVPTIWLRVPEVTIHYSCYTGLTSAANYADIPAGYK